MSLTTADQCSTSDEFDTLPDIWLPVWTTPTSVMMAIASGVALCTAAMIGCITALAVIFGLVYCIMGNFHIKTYTVILSALLPLIGFILYSPFKQRSLVAIVLAIIFLAVCALNIAWDMNKLIDAGIVGTFLLHGSALSGIALGNYAARIASPNRWREFHLKNKQCPRCRYDIRNLPTPRCPECGDTFEADLLP